MNNPSYTFFDERDQKDDHDFANLQIYGLL